MARIFAVDVLECPRCGSRMCILAASKETGFPLHIPKDVPPTALPNPGEVRLLREEIDPDGVYLGVF